MRAVPLAVPVALAALASLPAPAAAPARLPEPALAGSVRIVTDRWGVPHLRAGSLGDLYFAWGYVTARDRLWQLESRRRAGQGRMWKLLGNRALERDGAAQLFRFAERADAIWSRERGDPATRLALERYAAGVNAWLARCRAGAVPWPAEFERLGRHMANWRPEDSVLLLLGMGAELDLDLPELREARDIASQGAGWVAERRRYESRWTYTTVGGGAAAGPAPGAAGALDSPAVPAELAARAARVLAALAPERGTDGSERASNAFAVGARRSASGTPMLANDPHLSLATPGPFYVVHLSVPGTVDAAGACVPGLPAIVSGRNRWCAWGVTALSADVIDAYADTLDADGRRVRWRGGWAAIEEHPYALRYRLLGIRLPPFGQRRRYTPHGPVVAYDRHRRLAVSVRWSALEDGRITLGRMIGLERSRDADEVVRRFASLVTPTLNVVAADRSGRVRYRACGLVPVRPLPAPPGLVPGDGHHEWTGFVPTERMPAWSPPPDGFVVNSNNLPAPPTPEAPWPRFDWAHDRARRIAARLGGDRSITAADLRSVQNDVHSTMAERFVPVLVACADSARDRLSPLARAALDTLRAWDFEARRERVAPTLWRAWFGSLERRWGMPGLPARMLATLRGEARQWPPHHARETPAAAAAASLDSALAGLERLLGPGLPTWSWARAHRARFRHELGRAPGARGREGAPGLEPDPVPVDGDNSSPCVGPSRLPASVEVGHGPVFRHVVDLALPDSSWMVLPPGNSMASRALATAMLRRWRDHGYVVLRMDWASIDREAIDDVTLGRR